MAVVETHPAHDDHHHDHGEFIAHHFDSAEQQFDSGKLGIWIFLVTEVLFFSGLFLAYTLYRNHHPEIFEQAHVYLDKWLGGLNTVVLLFSSLTMAMAVRSAQLAKNKSCATYTLITMVCAAVFLGVKAVEYSHKWDMGIFVRSHFKLLTHHRLPQTGIGQALHVSDYLVYLSIIPAVLLVLFIGGSVFAKLSNKGHLSKLYMALAIMIGGYFLGAIGGQLYQNASSGQEGHASLAVPAPTGLALSVTPVVLREDEAKKSEPHAEKNDSTTDSHAAGEKHEPTADAAQHEHGEDEHAAGGSHTAHDGANADDDFGGHHEAAQLSPDVGIFFSIYYCMTGLHAMHIIGGIIALSWIYWRSILGHWRHDYFGPVDYVGLYWHLVDLIWIYLFPLLYLID